MQRGISALWSEKEVVLRETRRAVTPWGGLSVFVEFLRRRGYREQVRRHLPIRWESPNAIEPAQTFTAFLVAVLAGARRFAHAARRRGDRALQALLGMERFPTDDTIRNLFKRFRQKLVYEFFEPLWFWPLARMPQGGRATVWTWTRRGSSATGSRRERAEATIRGSTDGRRIIRCWRCWPKRRSFCTAGCAVGTVVRRAAPWSS